MVHSACKLTHCRLEKSREHCMSYDHSSESQGLELSNSDKLQNRVLLASAIWAMALRRLRFFFGRGRPQSLAAGLPLQTKARHRHPNGASLASKARFLSAFGTAAP
jgi:hypothetical protein